MATQRRPDRPPNGSDGPGDAADGGAGGDGTEPPEDVTRVVTRDYSGTLTLADLGF